MIDPNQKAIIHTARDGTLFQLDQKKFIFNTDEENTWLEVVRYGPMCRWKRMVLTLKGFPIEFAGPDDLPFEHFLLAHQKKQTTCLRYGAFLGLVQGEIILHQESNKKEQ